MATEASGIDLSLIVSIIAVVVSAVVSGVLFYFGYTRSKKSEQVRISKEIWDGIEPQKRIIYEWIYQEGRMPKKQGEVPPTDEGLVILSRALDKLNNDLGYFVFFIEIGEINDPNILRYYAGRVDNIYYNLREIIKTYDDMKFFSVSTKTLKLIFKYRKLLNLKLIFKYRRRGRRARIPVFMPVFDVDLHMRNIWLGDNKITIGDSDEPRYKNISWDDFEKDFQRIEWDDMIKD